MTDFKIMTPREWDSLVVRMDCPVCKEPMVLLFITTTITNVMKLTANPFAPTPMESATELQHMGFDIGIKVTDRCPSCMGEFSRTCHVEEGDRKILLNMLASVITR